MLALLWLLACAIPMRAAAQDFFPSEPGKTRKDSQLERSLAFATTAATSRYADVEVWLVTVEPGTEYWQRFGHNTLVIRPPGGRAISYNFGYFDFAQQDFLLRFLRGRMLYMAVALDADRDIGGYLEEGRRVWMQRLAFDAEQTQRLENHLRTHVLPENREYRYDYFTSNCSSKLRDALDLALEGALKRDSAHRSHGYSYRHFARAHAASLPWLYLGIDLGLGQPTDQALSLWDESFIPGELMRRMREFKDAAGNPIVIEEQVLPAGASTVEPWPPAPSWKPLFAAAGLFVAGALLALAALARRRSGARRAFGLIGGGLALLLAFIGSALAGLWLGTDHASAWRNENILLFSPLWLLTLPAWWQLLRGRDLAGGVWSVARFGLFAAVALAVFALAAKVLRGFNQGNMEWILLMLPIVAALGYGLVRVRRT